MEVLARSRLSSKEQLSLPAIIRRMLGIHAGDEIVWILDEAGRVRVESARVKSLVDLRANLAASGFRFQGKPATDADMKKSIAEMVRKKHAGR